MIIKNHEISIDTADRLYDYMPQELKNEKILINLGNSKIDEKEYKKYRIINKVRAIKRCVNKASSLNQLEKNGVSVVKSYNLKKFNPFLFLYLIFRYLIWGRDLVLKGRWRLEVLNLKSFFNILPKIEKFLYLMLKYEKTQEYRVILYKGKVVRIMEKIPNSNQFAWKNDNGCKFKEIPYYWHWIKSIIDIKRECVRASLLLKIDLCGIDIMRVGQDEVRILEVNSAMGLGRPSIRRLYKVILDELKTGWVNVG